MLYSKDRVRAVHSHALLLKCMFFTYTKIYHYDIKVKSQIRTVMCGLMVSHMGEARADRSSNLNEYNDLLWWRLEGRIPLSRESALAKIIGT